MKGGITIAAQTLKGNCYLCGAELGKTAMKNHIFKQHSDETQAQECMLIKAEGNDKNYWLYFDAPLTASLKNVDDFLRRIWLECCGHMSAFMGSGYTEYPMSRKLNRFVPGDKITHEYDFGSTTTLLITFVGITHRPKQREVVRLLARNVSPQFTCAECGAPATHVLMDRWYQDKDPFLCETCLRKEDDWEIALPVTNSPRMGVCGYTGEFDKYEYIPEKFRK